MPPEPRSEMSSYCAMRTPTTAVEASGIEGAAQSIASGSCERQNKEWSSYEDCGRCRRHPRRIDRGGRGTREEAGSEGFNTGVDSGLHEGLQLHRRPAHD